MKTETIAAIATAMTNAGISIVRISGENAIEIVDKIYRSKTGRKKLTSVPDHTIHYGFIIDEEKMIDEVIVLIMKAPNTYTKEDVVEIDCHGGMTVTKKVLETVVKYGARIAEPGEFTKRAFLNGRIDLSQAEAVMDIINAKNEYALKSSMNLLKGCMGEKIREIRNIILKDIAYIEAALDDPEHMTLDEFSRNLMNHIEEVKYRISELIRQSDNGRILTEGIKTVIIGKPNSGKSSLLNILLGEERAIVTNIEGTTRDSLEETINLDGITLKIVDTAGIRETKDEIEKIGVEKALYHAKEADLILYVTDISRTLDQNDEKIIRFLKDKKAVVLLNKSDLNIVIDEEKMRRDTGKNVISISVKENNGIEKLKDIIKELYFDGNIKVNDEVIVTNIRQKALLCEAADSLDQVQDSIKRNMPEDFYSIDLMSAYDSLGKIIGESIGEDLINTIFSEFCLGK